MSWSPETYLSFARERERPIAELIARLPPDFEPQTAVDLGCGTGNSTAALKMRFPHAACTGVDSSPHMLAKARAADAAITWAQESISDWTPPAPVDLIFSNAAYHWVPDHDALFPRLISHVNDGGVFAFQVPRNFHAPSHKLLFETATEEPWAAALKDARPFAPMDSMEAHYDRLTPHVRHLDIWETTYAHILEGDDAVFHWVSGTALTAFLPILANDQERDAFSERYKAKLRKAYPRRGGGKTVFPFRRLFVVAVK